MTAQETHQHSHIPSAVVGAIALVNMAMGLSAGAQGIVAETFDTGISDWTVYADSRPLVWDALGGNPGGAAKGVDNAEGGYWGFVAGSAFLGDRSCAYGGTVKWQLKISIGGSAGGTQPDVTLEGAGIVLVYDAPNLVQNTWTSFSVNLTESAGWKKNTLTGTVPTQEEFRSVLANVTALKFRGEFSTSADIGLIDNVSFGTFTLSSPDSIVACISNPVSLSVVATGSNPLTFQWQWRPTPGAAWINIVEGLNTDPDGGPNFFTAQNSQTATVSFTNLGEYSESTRSWENRCVVADTCTAMSIPATITVCPSDFNCDAIFDFFDYLDFVADFVANSPAADFNEDGVVDFFDYLDFVQVFSAGC